jgi:hypothetical protein
VSPGIVLAIVEDDHIHFQGELPGQRILFEISVDVAGQPGQGRASFKISGRHFRQHPFDDFKPTPILQQFEPRIAQIVLGPPRGSGHKLARMRHADRHGMGIPSYWMCCNVIL